ncbi:MAG: YggS family pyridoxal phosphate-dependent enzyme [Bacteroidota bacterium]|nr:YggS family pyridoxal phosphate-dependent enzyme [Bacteroidota bacterium]
MVAENLIKIRSRIELACRKSDRNFNEVTITAVTKTFSSELANEAVEAGIFDLGENYVQEFVHKKKELNDDRIRWHFIGHLQTNKVKFVCGQVDLIHSVDSLRLAKEISDFCLNTGFKQNILMEVNTSEEAAKFGIKPGDAQVVAEEIMRLPGLNLIGLMTIGRFSEDAEESRYEFRMLKEIKSDLEQKGIPLKHLSMGMSNDFDVAIEEGSTIIRLGTAIFGNRDYKK